MSASKPASPESVDFDPFAQAVERVISTTESQREVWLGDRLGSEASLAFNESIRLVLSGPVDHDALARAVQALVSRHEALRASFGPDGTEMLIGSGSDIAMTLTDLSSLSPSERDGLLRKISEAEVLTPFDLQRGPLFRASAYRIDAQTMHLLLTAHHIVCDGWSWGVIAQDLARLYREARQDGGQPMQPAVSYRDYARWEAQRANSDAMREESAFWLARFPGKTLPVLDLPVDRLRRGQRSFASRRHDHLIDAALLGQLRTRAAEQGVSLFAWLFSHFATLLHRLTGQDDLVIGVPCAGQSASGMQQLVGHCVNLLPIRVSVDGNAALESFAAQCSGVLLDAFEHQSLTYGALLKQLPVQRDPARLPLVSVMFNLDQPLRASQLDFGGPSAACESVPRRYEQFELFLNVSQIEQGLRLECQYLSDLIDADTVARWMRCYEMLLRSSLQHRNQALHAHALLAEADRRALEAIQPAAAPYPRDTLMHAAFEAQVRRTPERVALRFGDASLTYRQLDQRANRLARALRAAGVRRGVRVGVCIPREFDMVVAVLAVLKAGGAFVPLEPTLPEARLEFYAGDAAIGLLLTQGGVEHAPRNWCEQAGVAVMEIDHQVQWLAMDASPLAASGDDATAEDFAYVVYTSGSTGQPKGICAPHRPVVNFLSGMLSAPGISADDRLAMVTTLAFDPSILDLMLPLSVGAQILLVPQATVLDAQALCDALERNGITLLQATPSLWRNLLMTSWRRTPQQRGTPFRGFIGGEALPQDLALALCERIDELWNLYGPTETTVWATAWRVEPSVMRERGASIGRPIANARVWILDEQGHPCPIGVSGEICIAGEGVTPGYLNRDELTARQFVADPFGASGSRLYRSGDRGRWRNDGLLDHQGRFDFQVKLRGYRIELGEIESVSNELESVGQTAVLAREDRPGDPRLVAYLVARPDCTIDREQWRAHLRHKLPDYMVPAHLVILDRFPLLSNGKLDRKALPAPDPEATTVAAERMAPRTETEIALLAAMTEVLNLPGMGIQDDFFAFGGHSLLAARLTARINREFDLNLPLRTLFEAPTVQGLAVAVDAIRRKGGQHRIEIAVDAKRRRAPLTIMQERIRFLEELHPGRSVYNEPSAHRLRGPMDVERFRQALNQVVARQSALRTRVVATEDGYLQEILSSVEVALPVEDLGALPADRREDELMRRMQRLTDTPIPLDRAPMFHARLYRLSPQEHVFLFVPHHLIWDGWSFDLLYDEMAAIYGSLQRGLPSSLPAPAVSYGDFAEWHRKWLGSEEFAQALGYWRQRLASAPPTDPIPSDKPRRPGMTGAGAAQWIRIDSALTERLRVIARDAGLTMSMLMMSVFTLLMQRLRDDGAVTIGVPVRGRLIAEVDPVMGFFNNLVAVHVDAAGRRPFLEFAAALRAEVLEVFDHQDVPFESLVVDPQLSQRLKRSGLYHALFSFQDARHRIRRWGDLSHQSILMQQSGATEDIGMWLMEVPAGMEGGFIYNTELFEAATLVRCRDEFIRMLGRLVAQPHLGTRELMGDFRHHAGAGSTVDAGRVAAHAGSGVTANPLPASARSTSTTAAAAIPATPAIPAIASADSPSKASAVAPSGALSDALTDTEREVQQIWRSLLGVNRIQPGDNFFDLGGSSLLAMQAVERIAQACGKRIPAGNLAFDTLGQIAAALDQAPARAGDAGSARSSASSAPPRKGGLLQRLAGGLRRK